VFLLFSTNEEANQGRNEAGHIFDPSEEHVSAAPSRAYNFVIPFHFEGNQNNKHVPQKRESGHTCILSGDQVSIHSTEQAAKSAGLLAHRMS
jgi:hypothetical protein